MILGAHSSSKHLSFRVVWPNGWSLALHLFPYLYVILMSCKDTLINKILLSIAYLLSIGPGRYGLTGLSHQSPRQISYDKVLVLTMTITAFSLAIWHTMHVAQHRQNVNRVNKIPSKVGLLPCCCYYGRYINMLFLLWHAYCVVFFIVAGLWPCCFYFMAGWLQCCSYNGI